MNEDLWCGWCKPNQHRFATYAVTYAGPGPRSKAALRTCGRHLTRVIAFVTQPGGTVEVEVLK